MGNILFLARCLLAEGMGMKRWGIEVGDGRGKGKGGRDRN